jgi:ABC-2 type transport system permease protein
MSTIADSFSDMGAFTAAFGMDRLSISTPLGYYGIEIGAVLSLGGALFAAMIGTGLLSKEEGGHTSEFLYTLPFNRINIILQKIVAVFIIILGFDITNFIVGVAAFPLIDAEIEWKTMLIYHLAQFLMHFEIAAISILISAFTKKLNLGIGLGIAMILYFLDMMSRILEQLEKIKYITPFYYANAADVMTGLRIERPLLLIGLCITVCSMLLGTWYYNKRDLSI